MSHKCKFNVLSLQLLHPINTVNNETTTQHVLRSDEEIQSLGNFCFTLC